jgi:hypothetical protein
VPELTEEHAALARDGRCNRLPRSYLLICHHSRDVHIPAVTQGHRGAAKGDPARSCTSVADPVTEVVFRLAMTFMNGADRTPRVGAD